MSTPKQATLDKMYALGVRGIECSVCGTQRHAPRIPEARHGWVQLLAGGWLCAECAKPKEGRW